MAKALPKMPNTTKRVPIDKDMSKDKPAPKSHARTPKKSEIDLLKEGRRLAALYLVQRDGLDLEMALMVVEGMEPEDINALNFEANSSVIERAAPSMPSAGTPENVGGTQEEKGAILGATPPKAAVDFLSVPLLATDEDFASLALGIPELAVAKKKAELMLKTAKAKVIEKARAAGAYKLTVAEWNVSVFEGGSSHIDGLKLIEAGVDPAVVKKCTVPTKYWDVKVTPPGTPKGEANGEQNNS